MHTHPHYLCPWIGLGSSIPTPPFDIQVSQHDLVHSWTSVHRPTRIRIALSEGQQESMFTGMVSLRATLFGRPDKDISKSVNVSYFT